MARQERQFFLSLSQGGDVNRVGAQVQVEIFAKSVFRKRSFHISGSRSQNADIDVDQSGISRSDEALVLQHPQQRGLQAQRHLGDLV